MIEADDDQTTQQNAAMVEESTAASSALAQEAVRLRDLIAKFRLSGSDTMRHQGSPGDQAANRYPKLARTAG